MPIGAKSFARGHPDGRRGLPHRSRRVLKKAGHNTNVGDEGGLRAEPRQRGGRSRSSSTPIDKAGYTAGRDKDVAIALDCASSELFDEGEKKGYKFWKSAPDKLFSSQQMIDLFAEWVDKYPIISIEDPLDQDDWAGYTAITKALGDKVQIVGDDFFVTNTERLSGGHRRGLHQQHPDQGQPDRHADRDAGSHRDGPSRRLHVGHQPPLGRDRGRDHRRHRRGDQRRPDQDRLGQPVRPRSPSTTSSSASRKTWATRRCTGRRSGSGFEPCAETGSRTFRGPFLFAHIYSLMTHFSPPETGG